MGLWVFEKKKLLCYDETLIQVERCWRPRSHGDCLGRRFSSVDIALGGAFGMEEQAVVVTSQEHF